MKSLKKIFLILFILSTTFISFIFIISLAKVPIRQSYIDFINNFLTKDEKVLDHYSDKQNIIIRNQLYSFQLYKKSLQDYTNFNHYNASRLPAGYLEKFGENFIFVSGDGKIILFDKNLNLIKEIKSNLTEEILDQRPPKGWYSIRDITRDSENAKIFYISYYKRCDENKWKMSFFKTKVENFDVEFIDFVDLDPFSDEHCVSNPEGTHSGGRIINFDQDNLLVTVGDWTKSSPQVDNSIYGKIIKVKKTGEDYKIFSKGHRNPQGLTMFNKELIFSSEHGHEGGDELNKIIENKNYGWPKVSYSTTAEDPRYEKNIKHYNSDKTHKDLGFEDPLIALTPSIGPSEVMSYTGDYFSYWKYKIIMSSLKAQSLFIITLNESFDKINHIEKIHIGSRIRDFITTDEGMYLVLEGRYGNQKDTPNLGKITIEF